MNTIEIIKCMWSIYILKRILTIWPNLKKNDKASVSPEIIQTYTQASIIQRAWMS
jgi:hypothetical protein